jgi:hypothetical protein
MSSYVLVFIGTSFAAPLKRPLEISVDEGNKLLRAPRKASRKDMEELDVPALSSSDLQPTEETNAQMIGAATMFCDVLLRDHLQNWFLDEIILVRSEDARSDYARPVRLCHHPTKLFPIMIVFLQIAILVKRPSVESVSPSEKQRPRTEYGLEPRRPTSRATRRRGNRTDSVVTTRTRSGWTRVRADNSVCVRRAGQ